MYVCVSPHICICVHIWARDNLFRWMPVVYVCVYIFVRVHTYAYVWRYERASRMPRIEWHDAVACLLCVCVNRCINVYQLCVYKCVSHTHASRMPRVDLCYCVVCLLCVCACVYIHMCTCVCVCISYVMRMPHIDWRDTRVCLLCVCVYIYVYMYHVCVYICDSYTHASRMPRADRTLFWCIPDTHRNDIILLFACRDVCVFICVSVHTCIWM